MSAYLQQFLCPLYLSHEEHTYLEKLKPHQSLDEHSLNGMELLILQGELITDEESYPAGAWIRLPIQSSHSFYASAAGVTLYVKTGHLSSAQKFMEQQS